MIGDLIWHDGRLVPRHEAVVPIDSLAVGLGASVFEAFRAYALPSGATTVFRLFDHLKRLEGSMAVSRISLSPHAEELAGGVGQAIAANQTDQNLYVRITVYCPQTGMSVMHPSELRYSAAVLVRAVAVPLPPKTGLECAVSSWRRLDSAATPTRIKAAGNYHNSRLAAFEAKLNGYDNAILLDAAGSVTEAADASVVAVHGGVVVTPPVSTGGLESITRDTIIQLARDEGLAVEIRDIDRAELYSADEVFLTNSAHLVRPVLSIDKLAIGDGVPGPVTGLLCERLARALKGETHPEWSTPVDQLCEESATSAARSPS